MLYAEYLTEYKEETNVPVNPAVTLPINCAQNIDVANGKLYPPIKNDMIAITEPIATPMKCRNRCLMYS